MAGLLRIFNGFPVPARHGSNLVLTATESKFYLTLVVSCTGIIPQKPVRVAVLFHPLHVVAKMTAKLHHCSRVVVLPRCVVCRLRLPLCRAVLGWLGSNGLHRASVNWVPGASFSAR